jgi:LmbE family N-acetylglucosaminyl deacetylase
MEKVAGLVDPENISEFVPQLRPHNRRRDNRLFFMISRRPLLELSPDEISLYEDINGNKTVGDLERVHAGATERLLQWRDAFVLELLPPISKPARPHLVIIEPHMDDAVLSAGGRLLHRRGNQRITILSVVKWSNFTSFLKLNREFLNVADVTEMRFDESALAAKMLGAEFTCLDWHDAPLRFWPAERWSRETIERFNANPTPFVSGPPSPQDVAALAQQLTEVVTRLEPDELWIPMGLGHHVDHRTTRSACLRMLAEAHGRLWQIPVSLYEDLPYAVAPKHVAQLEAAFESVNAQLTRGRENITDVFQQKLRLVSVYASQFKLSYMEPMLREIGGREAGVPGAFAEAYHRLKGARRLPAESCLAPEAHALDVLKTDARQLVRERTKLRRLTVLALPSGHLGRFGRDSKTLKHAFPNAYLSIYASERVAWQAEANGSGQPHVHVVRRGKLGCLAAILRQLFSFRTPTVVLCAGAYNHGFKNKLIRILLPFRHVLLAKVLCDVCCVLNEQVAPSLAVLVAAHRSLPNYRGEMPAGK